MKAIVFLDGQIAEGYGDLKCEGIMAFTKEASSMARLKRANASKIHFSPKAEVHGVAPSKKNRKKGAKVKVAYK